MSNRTLIERDIDNMLILRRFVAIQEAVERISSTFYRYEKTSSPIETPNFAIAIRERAMDIEIIKKFANDLQTIELDDMTAELAKRYPSVSNAGALESTKEADHG